MVVDESAGVSESIFQAIEGILTGPNAKLLLIGNPNNASGTFYEAFRSPLYQTFHIQATDVPERFTLSFQSNPSDGATRSLKSPALTV